MKYTRFEWDTLMRVLAPADEMSAVERILAYCGEDDSQPDWYEVGCDIHISSHTEHEKTIRRFIANVYDYFIYACDFSVVETEDAVSIEAEEQLAVIAAFQFLCTEDDENGTLIYNGRRFWNLKRYQLNVRRHGDIRHPFVTRYYPGNVEARSTDPDTGAYIDWCVEVGSQAQMYEEAFYMGM